MNFRNTLILLFFILQLSANAYYPKAEVDVKNSKLNNRKLEELDQAWFLFLEDKTEVLRPKGKKYTVDQSSAFTIDTNENGDLLYPTLKRIKQKRENPDFNLAAIEFLRNQNINLKKKNAEKPITINFKYYAF